MEFFFSPPQTQVLSTNSRNGKNEKGEKILSNLAGQNVTFISSNIDNLVATTADVRVIEINVIVVGCFEPNLERVHCNNNHCFKKNLFHVLSYTSSE